MKRILWPRKNPKYAGFRIKGSVPMSKENRDTHIKRASWLTAMVESNGVFGSVMNFDGTGMTAGIHQAIAVYPRELINPDGKAKNDQGPLWKLLNRLSDIVPGHKIWRKIERAGWYIAQDNTLRFIDTGKYVDGFAIREEFNGSKDGVVPLRGKDRNSSEHWIIICHDLMSNEKTFLAQEKFGEEHFVKRAKRVKLRFSKNFKEYTIDRLIYRNFNHITHADFSLSEMDLAMCMFWNYTVNAPSQALKIMCKVSDYVFGYGHAISFPEDLFSEKLIRSLGTSSWGRWDDDIKNGRYQRTRKYAMMSGFWPKKLFVGKNAIMPVDL